MYSKIITPEMPERKNPETISPELLEMITPEVLNLCLRGECPREILGFTEDPETHPTDDPHMSELAVEIARQVRELRSAFDGFPGSEIIVDVSPHPPGASDLLPVL